jgi:hypothetical protein
MLARFPSSHNFVCMFMARLIQSMHPTFRTLPRLTLNGRRNTPSWLLSICRDSVLYLLHIYTPSIIFNLIKRQASITIDSILNTHLPRSMESDAISQLKALLNAAPDLRSQLSNAERLQLSGLAEALRNELERPDEAIFRVTFNEVCLTCHATLSKFAGLYCT